ncbi:hypothetical protein G9A89_014563, partial [Geosiphon pyriformis]
MAVGFTSLGTAGFRTYFIKALHHRLPVAVHPRVAACNMVFFVHKFCAAFRDEIWLVRAKHQAVMEKGRLILHDGSIPASISGFSMGFSAGVVRLLGIANAISICFGFH